MQLLAEPKMQDGVTDASNDEDFSKGLQEPHHVTVDLSDITSRYQDICPLGCGANALIFSAIDHQCHRRLAVKKVSLKQCHSANSLKRLFREIRILRRLDHDNVVRIYHTLVSSRSKDFNSPLHIPAAMRGDHCTNNLTPPMANRIETVYIGMELMDTDLYNILQHRSLSPNYTKLFMYQLLRGLKYIHSANVVHRDITPSNIFINIDTLMLKIGDFGVSRILDPEYDHTGHLSMASTTTKYQAPELILHPRHYTKSIDMWAVGCVFAEMLSGKPLFTGECCLDQMNQILSCIPVTSACWRNVAEAGCENRSCCPDSEAYGVRDNGGQPSRTLCDIFSNAFHDAVSLLRQMLAFDPADRITASDALMHPYLVTYSQARDEPVCTEAFKIEDELDDFSITKYQELLSSEASTTPSLVSNESALAETSHEDSTSAMRTVPLSHPVLATESCKDLLALVHSSNPSMGSVNNPAITMSESEARTMACDFDYGVQITDGSVNRERKCLDFVPIRSNSACFDPYKWDVRGNNDTAEETQTKVTSNITYHKTPILDGNHSDHGYHSSYCSSNLSHGKVHLHAMWSLSSPDVSIDPEKSSHRASTPDFGDAASPALVENEDHHNTYDSRHSPSHSSDDKNSDHSDGARRRHKDGIPRHHQSYGHHSHYHHHHHHHHGHHHHHKHHRHSSRHSGTVTQQQQRSSSNEADSSSSSNNGSRFLQRRCVVTDTVPEAAEENISVENNKVEDKSSKVTEINLSDQNFNHSDIDPTECSVLRKLAGLRKITKSERRSKAAKHNVQSERPIAKNSGVAEHHADVAPVQPFSSEKQAFTLVAEAINPPNRTNLAAAPTELTSRCRTRSDGSQFKRPDGGLVYSIQNGLNQFGLRNLLKKKATTPSVDSPCILRRYQPRIVVKKRMRPFSLDTKTLDEISILAVDKANQFGATIEADGMFSPPLNCWSTNEKPLTVPRTQVECPF